MTPAYGPPPRLAATWYKGHGLGNDYLVFQEGAAWTATPAAIEAVCHRWTGVGGDGIVVVTAAGGPGTTPGSPDAPFRLRMFNPDGSEFERSGNGLRVLASWLHRTDRVGAGPFHVEVGGDRIRMEVHGRDRAGRYDASVEMGRARVGATAVALSPVGEAAGAGDPARARLVQPEGGEVPFVPVSVGNPHAVVFADDLAAAGFAPGGAASDPFGRATLDRVGPWLARHSAFAAGTNVQLARAVAGEAAVEALIWERGVGPTTASGTSACAVAVAAVRTGRVAPGALEVRMEGGRMTVTVSAELDVVLRGPVQEVATGELTAGFLRWLEEPADGEG